MIRAMTIPEIQAALRHGAQVCIERRLSWWGSVGVLLQDGAFFAACDCVDKDEEDDADTPEHAAHFLLIAAEAIEP